VAAYCRVSVGTDETLGSLTAQISHYTKLIKSRPNWEYAGVYADFAETGTKPTRPEFQRLLADCRAGKIGYVFTKSISRFARNTVTLIETVRELKTFGVSVYFEEQGIDSMSADGELMLTLLASVAQEESLATSENIKWRKRHDMERGLTVPKKVYGYDVQGNQLVINPQQAQVVEVIFTDYLKGKSCTQIANFFNSCGLPSPYGKRWLRHTIRSILMNEKMCGNVLHQKRYSELIKTYAPKEGKNSLISSRFLPLIVKRQSLFLSLYLRAVEKAKATVKFQGNR
jgi:DNA invertase Pin-like site-specific DNA recombinase